MKFHLLDSRAAAVMALLAIACFSFIYNPRLLLMQESIEMRSGVPESIRKSLFPLPEEFKGLMADVAYAQADQHFHSGKWYKILPFLRTAATLRPERTDSWSTGSWHLAFNTADAAATEEERDKYIKIGFDFIDEGIRKHPDIPHLYFDRGWTYFMRLKDYNRAIINFKKALEMEYEWKYVTWLAYAYHKSKKFSEEVLLWKNHLEKNPQDEKAMGHYKEALRLSEENKGERS